MADNANIWLLTGPNMAGKFDLPAARTRIIA